MDALVCATVSFLHEIGSFLFCVCGAPDEDRVASSLFAMADCDDTARFETRVQMLYCYSWEFNLQYSSIEFLLNHICAVILRARFHRSDGAEHRPYSMHVLDLARPIDISNSCIIVISSPMNGTLINFGSFNSGWTNASHASLTAIPYSVSRI